MSITIISYQEKHQPAFYSLNVEWLDKYNLTESHDLMVLNDPRGTIIEHGGYIWMAEADRDLVGSVALMKDHEEGVYELAKMAVRPDWQGKGISKLLIETSLAKAKEIGALRLILFSNHQLQTALSLYTKYGFRHVEVHDSPFVTADVRMELDL